MGVKFRFDFSEVDKFITDVEEVDAFVRAAFRRAMRMSVDIADQAITNLTPVGASGNLRASIEGEVVDQWEATWSIIGKIESPMIYGIPVEWGRRPGKMPPPEALVEWVIRKAGVSSQEAESVAWLVARAIAARGTKGAFMFRDGMKVAEPRITALWEAIPQQVINYLSS